MGEAKRSLKRFLALLLTLAMVVTALPGVSLTAWAVTDKSGTVSGLTDSNIGLTYEGDGSDYVSWKASGTTVDGSAISSSGCSTNHHETSLIITNNRSIEAQLSFDYTIAVNGGTIQIANDAVTADGSFSKTLAGGESVKVYIKSNSTSSATTIKLTNLALASNVEATATFKPAENGSYTVDGKTITEEYSNTQSAMNAYKLVATPADGFQFLGWWNETSGKYVSTSATVSYNVEEDCTITARFASKDAGLFETGGQVYTDLNDAVEYAQESNQTKITMLSNATLTGSYTIPSGITLLIPNDSSNTLYTDTPEAVEGDKGTRTAYRTLTMAEGSSLTVNGGLSISGWYKAAAGSAAGYMTGAYGLISMAGSSSITVKSGGYLYAWGFVTGSGSVTVESGGTVMEWYQITDFRGGSATMGMGNKVFPISQYYIQNVEVPMTLYAGATETAYTGVYASGRINSSAIPLIGSNGMFNITSGSITKAYNGSSDRMQFTINGTASMNQLSLKLAGSTVSSGSYVLPITNNFSINIASGKFEVAQTVALLPGVEITIANGAEMEVKNGITLYVYDMSEWGGYVGGYNSQSIPVQYSPTKTTSCALADAKIDVNGTLTAAGTIYTTASGANICSSAGTGKYVQQNAAGTETKTYQYTQSGSSVTAHEIAITPAKLLNADGTYTETKDTEAGTTINYVDGTWGGEEVVTYTVNYDANGGEGSMEAQTENEGSNVALAANSFTRTGYNFTGWNTAADGSGKPYAAGGTLENLSSDVTLYAQWEKITYKVTWIVEGVSVKTDTVAYGETPTYTGAAPTKEGNAQYSYTFTGWTPEIEAVTKDVTYTAEFTESVNTYTITWQNADGTVISTETLAYGTTPSYTGDTPTLAATETNGYKFSGWTPEITAVTGNATYTAEYTNTYTVTWMNGDTTIYTETVDAGATPVYDEAAYGTPSRTEDERNTYTFSGWTPAVGAINANTTYTAQFSETRKQVTVTFDANGGEGAIAAQVVNTVEDTALTANNNQLTRTGYTFAGWNTAPDGTGTAYEDAAAVNLTADLTLYAQWSILTFTVTWVNEDGSVLETDTDVAYGTTPTFDGGTPAKASTAEFTYTFAGWTPEVTAVTADVTYRATYTSATNLYTVTWVNEDGSSLGSAQFYYGSTPTYSGETPAKAGDEEHTYTFAGWTPEVAVVTGDATYTAVFTETENLYTVIWTNWDGTELYRTAEGVAYTAIDPHTYAGETPTREGDAQNTYTFSDWSQVTVDRETFTVVYQAVFSAGVNSYTIYWTLDDGTLLSTSTAEYGAMPAYSGETPTKTGDAQYSYTFTGWTPEFTAVTGDATYTAVFEQTENTYTVTWMNADGTVLETDEEVVYGSKPEYNGETPIKAEDESTIYTFAGWSPEITEKTIVTGDVTYTATYTGEGKTFTVTWTDENGTVLETDEGVLYGTTPTYDGAEPTKEGDAQYTYTFAGWNPTTDTVKADVTYQAVFKQTVNTYTITWKSGETTLRTDQVAYGEMPDFGAEAPTKEADAQYTYAFTGWSPEVAAVTGDATYGAQFASTVNTYTVTWLNEDGTTLETDKNVEYGAVPTYDGETPVKAEDARYTYIFNGWNPALTAETTVTGNMTFQAVYTPFEKTFTVTWADENGTVLETDENVAYGANPEYNGAAPTKGRDAEGYSYTFAGWTPALAAVKGNVTYTAVYNKSANRAFTITWKDEDGTVLQTGDVEAGKTPGYMGETPSKEADDTYRYTFSGWTPEVTTVSGDAVYTAVYGKTERVWHTVTFDANGGAGEMTAQSLENGISTELTANTFTRENYKFTGWNTAADGSGAVYTDGASILSLDADLTLYAQWSFQRGWLTDSIGKTYLIDGEKAYFSTWQEIDGDVYCFDENGYVMTGIQSLTKDGVSGKYLLDETTGVFRSDYTGVYTTAANETYWLNAGVVKDYAGLKKVVDGSGHIHYYYFGEDGKAVKNGSYTVVKNNDLELPCYSYRFDEDGVIVHDDDTSKNGICEGDGSKFYYIDGVKVGEGLLYIDGAYYYARTSSGEIVKNRSYWVTKTNDLPIKAGSYRFDADGKMILGFIDIDGYTYYYYENGTLAKGFTKIGEDYYFFNAGSGKLYKGVTLWVGENSYGVTGGWYAFGEDGKLIKTGFVTGGGYTYYYNDMTLAKGFTKIGEDYYLFNAGSGKMYKSATMWVGTNDYGFTGGMYCFGEDGKMVIPDLDNGTKAIVTDENGKMHFTIDGFYVVSGLYELDGNYYYADSNGNLAVDKTVYISTSLLSGTGWYGFDESGKLILTGFVMDTNGYVYYYENGVRAKGLKQIDGDLYLFNSGSGKMYRNGYYWVSANEEGLSVGRHYFNAQGRLEDM